MFKTCISVAAVGKAPEIVKKVIDNIGWPISTIIIEPGRVSFYVCYKWYQYYRICAFKMAVKNVKNIVNITINPIFMGSDLCRGQNFLQKNSKKHTKDSPMKSFEEILMEEMSKL